ncbi:MAG: response regulator transcription factor [Chloroflexi bacterium]|nr:response regulator transcription factor [Chloroflexota bacterium]
MADAPEPQRSCHVLVAESNPDVRAALRLLMARHPELRVVGEAQNVDELLRDMQSLQPDIVLLDCELRGFVFGQHFAQLRGRCAVVALSTHEEQRQLALDAGAAAFVSKTESPVQLLATLRSLLLAQTA